MPSTLPKTPVAPHDQRAFFEEQGYLIDEGLLSPGELAECQAEIRRLHQVAAELEANDDPASRDFQREPFARDASLGDLPVLRKIERTGRYSEVFHRLAAHPRLVGTAQSLIGPELLLFRSTLMLKPAFHGSAHGLHQDSAYWPMDPPTLVTVSIALNDATPENGCFQVIPQSHQWGLQQWGRIARDKDEPLTDRDDVDLSARIEVPLAAGSALFFHSLLVHGSGPNNSAQPRNTALYAYFPSTVRYVPGANAPRQATYRVIAGRPGQEELTLTADEAPG
jgi:ectoine hydroxylase-related dioxygenase (phytanoyl-CoA dioxygenase family)